MSGFLVRCENKVYANDELYCTAIAGGERALIKMLASKAVISKTLLDQVLYPVTIEQQKICESYNPVYQDFDEAVKYFNVLSGDTLMQIKVGNEQAFPKATVFNVGKAIPEFFKHRHITFFRVQDYKESRKYRMLSKMAAVKLLGRCYIALNAVDVRVETPIIVTLKN
jgi:hypothetical protein